MIVSRSEIIFRTRFAAKGLAVADFLEVVQAAGDAFIAVAVEGIEVDGRTPIDSSSEK